MNNRGLGERFPLEIGERTIYCIVRKHPRAKRVSVRILSRSEVVLVVPEKGSLGNAKEFLVSKREWIAKKTFQLPERESWKSFPDKMYAQNIDDFNFLDYTKWSKKELLFEEFKSLGFYISDHPLNEFKEVFDQLNIHSYKDFLKNEKNEALVAGTIMSIQEKKSAKGTPYAIVKFSDKKCEFELFLFAEILVSNRDKLKESESFVLTLQKDRITGDATKKRINVKKILNLEEVINKPYSRVTIELKDDLNVNEIKQLLSNRGDTEINFLVRDINKQATYSLQENRKFDLNLLKTLKAKKYVEKITV